MGALRLQSEIFPLSFAKNSQHPLPDLPTIDRFHRPKLLSQLEQLQSLEPKQRSRRFNGSCLFFPIRKTAFAVWQWLAQALLGMAHYHLRTNYIHSPTSASDIVTCLATAGSILSAATTGAKSSCSATVSTVAVIICEKNYRRPYFSPNVRDTESHNYRPERGTYLDEYFFHPFP